MHASALQTAIDPICGMTVDIHQNAGTASRDGKTYYFCSRHCIEIFNKSASPSRREDHALATYYPLILIFFYLVSMVFLVSLNTGDTTPMTLMNHFMGGFFLIFSFFKFLDLKGFAENYQSYDIVAKRSLAYAYAYPFIELLLGIAYISHFSPLTTNIATALVMGVSSVGVLQSLAKKQKIQCACLGTMFKLPMSTVTLIEDALMFFMALAMIRLLLNS